ncbi:AsmA-like C-terminal domain-containing protein [Sulfurimonas sp.]|uniref:YhdP family protein n=1 Tax=Sulfurimonas sp. TaxID=2022749 RepID=UPI0025E99E83|nr:AsmA-like C-terminal domain-containing protein [Sulfurimonas sp.]
MSVQELKITKDSKQNNDNLSVETVSMILKSLLLFDNWFERFEINKITFNDIDASFLYIDGSNGYFIASSEDFSLKSSLFYESNYLNAEITEFSHFKNKINVDGNIIFDDDEKELISNLNININSDVFLKAYVLANTKKLFYKVKAKEKIKSLKHTMEIVDMPKEVKYWAYDAITFEDLELQNISGWLEYEKLSDAYKNILVKASASELTYTYNKELEPVFTQKTELEFKEGVLYIRPQETYQYGFNLQDSWLKIDFSKKEELLSLFLNFDGKVNKDLLYLLNTYKIKLPILQNSGSVKTDLKITVGLRKIEIDAKGIFYVNVANFNYLGLDIDVNETKVYLDNYDVRIPKMNAKYKDIATALVDVVYDAKKSEGKIDFELQDVSFNELKLKQKPLKATYSISNKQDIIEIEKSKWSYKDKFLEIDGLNILFDLETLKAQVPTAYLKMKGIATIFASGELSLNPLKTDFDIDLLTFNLNNVKMNQSSASLKLEYDNRFIINSDEDIRFSANGLDYTLGNTILELDENEFRVMSSKVNIKDLADTKFNASYVFDKNRGFINLKELHFKNADVGEIFSSKKILRLDLEYDTKGVNIVASDFDAKFNLEDSGWKLKFNSLEKLSKNSKLLLDNNITNGDFSIYKKDNEKNIGFFANIKYPYKFLTYNDKPIEDYVIRGHIDKDTSDILLNINNSIDAKISKEIKIWANDIGININALLSYIKDRNSESKSEKNIIFDSKDCYFYIGENRHIISKTMQLQYFNNIINAQLKHRAGNAGFELKEGIFYLYGDGFGDDFMDKLFYLSDFKGGDLSFSMQGSLDDYKGLIHIKNTTIVDYKILNNILAFVNTIPSLVTFSLPGYSKKGLEVNNAYASFHSKDDSLNFSDISLDSKEMIIVGYGTANYIKNSIDLTLNLKTDLGSSVSKIPVVGYILLGKDSISTSVKVSGELTDPKVSSLIAKDIIVAPLNIIKRTIFLPFEMFSDDKKEKK